MLRGLPGCRDAGSELVRGIPIREQQMALMGDCLTLRHMRS